MTTATTATPVPGQLWEFTSRRARPPFNITLADGGNGFSMVIPGPSVGGILPWWPAEKGTRPVCIGTAILVVDVGEALPGHGALVVFLHEEVCCWVNLAYFKAHFTLMEAAS